MGRRRRGRKRRIYRPKKKIPTVFPCPNCGKKNVGVYIDKKAGIVIVKCGACLTEAKFEYDERLKPIDYYSKFVDKVYEGALETSTQLSPELITPTSSSENEKVKK